MRREYAAYTCNLLHVLLLFVLRAWCLTTMHLVTLADALGGNKIRDRGAQIHYFPQHSLETPLCWNQCVSWTSLTEPCPAPYSVCVCVCIYARARACVYSVTHAWPWVPLKAARVNKGGWKLLPTFAGLTSPCTSPEPRLQSVSGWLASLLCKHHLNKHRRRRGREARECTWKVCGDKKLLDN